jgi:hypothetical protein
MDPHFIEKTKQWLELDDQVTKIKEKLAETNDARKVVEDEILQYVEQHDLDKVTVNISDGRIKFPKQSVRQSPSLKYLKTTLTRYNEEKEAGMDIDAIYKFLVDNLETKTKMSIKRDVR